MKLGGRQKAGNYYSFTTFSMLVAFKSSTQLLQFHLKSRCYLPSGLYLRWIEQRFPKPPEPTAIRGESTTCRAEHRRKPAEMHPLSG